MIIEELEDFFWFSKLWRLGVFLECPTGRKAGSLPVLVCQAIGSHDRLEQLVAGNGDVADCEPGYKPECRKGQRGLYGFGGEGYRKSSEDFSEYGLLLTAR